MTDLDLDDLRADLDDFAQPKKADVRSPKEERIIAGFEDIQRFAVEHGRAPQHGEDRDIFERLYAVRLDRLRSLEECRTILAPLDHQELMAEQGTDTPPTADAIDVEALAAELGPGIVGSEITQLRHVRTNADKRAAEEIANRQKCEEFDAFKPLFEQVQRELDEGVRMSRIIRKEAGFLKTDIKNGQFFILGGQTLYVSDVGEPIKAPNGEFDARLRVIYANGTESNLLRRSLQRALYKDEAGRQITEPGAGPLFAGHTSDDDETSGKIYVLRSKSEHPTIANNRDVLHKIGVTGGDVERRIANAKTDPTYLMADVELVATYDLYNINRTKLENLIHRVFEPARLNIEVMDRFGKPVAPREWFLVPLFVINEAVGKIKDGTLPDYRYDPAKASLVASTDE